MASLIPLARALRLPVIVAGALLLAHSACAQTMPLPRGAEKAPEALRPMLGSWDLELAGAARKCTIMLAPETMEHGRRLRFPATCRRALPVLDTIVSWNATPKGALRLDNASGQPVLTFEETDKPAGGGGKNPQGKSLEGKSSDGKSYLLTSGDYPRAPQSPGAKPAESAATSAQRPTVVDPARAPAAELVPGLYSVMRQQNREACKLALSPGAATVRAPAAFEGSCQDTGLQIFDPTGWRYAAGRLTLVARKGHGVDLVFENGQWRKDPAVGAPLMLRKLP